MSKPYPFAEKVLHWFKEISEIPRCSKDEDIVCDYLVDWAEDNNFEVKEDEARNILIKVPAKGGMDKHPTVILQGHVDMVCEKTPESKHDFSQDPIELVFGDDGWLRAKDTSLGADNGIAIALAMALALDENISHPPLELLFTVDEETGLTGANALQPGFIEGKILLNLDSEEEGVFTIGCAGGRDTNINLPLEMVNIPSCATCAVEISIGGLKGGHSGMNINAGRANAIQLLTRVLKSIDSEFELVAFEGGTAHNAIPRDARAVILVIPDDIEIVENVVHNLNDRFVDEYQDIEPDLTAKVRVIDSTDNNAVSASSTERMLDLLLALPHGVLAYSQKPDGAVETSNNLATVKVDNGMLEILLSQRSSVKTRLDYLTQKIEAIGNLSGAAVSSSVGYPSWQPNYKSRLLEKCQQTYKALTKEEAKAIVIHAGLECGVIGSKYDGMDMISLGPNIKYPHSPDEMMEIKSIDNTYKFMTALLSSL